MICWLLFSGLECVGIVDVEIEWICDWVWVDIYIVCLGIVIGWCGIEVDWICVDLEKLIGK